MKNELIKKIEGELSAVEFFKLKPEIVKALGKTALSRKLEKMNSVVDFYASKEDVIYELTGKEPKEKKGDE